MNKLWLMALLLCGAPICAEQVDKANCQQTNLTLELHAQARLHQNPNITQSTHPVLYKMIEDLAHAAKTAMPRYITICDTQTLATYQSANHGYVYKDSYNNNIMVTVDIFGDLHICHAIVSELSYQQIRGILAVAIAAKATRKAAKIAAAGALTGVVAGGVGAVVSAIVATRHGFNRKSSLHARSYLPVVESGICSGIAAGWITANNLQRQIDIEAARIADVDTVIAGIKGIEQLKEYYVKEHFVSRIASAIKLDKVYNIVCYPVREFTAQERIGYLEDLKNIKQ